VFWSITEKKASRRMWQALSIPGSKSGQVSQIIEKLCD
jgi:hypothetical protein